MRIAPRSTLPHALAALLPLLALSLFTASATAAVELDKLKLPAGFRAELVTDAVPNARQMTLGRTSDGKSMVYVGSMR
ncbi:MAG: hypothetical protein ABI281_12500, partial [Caldimonas sp.]